MFRHLQRVLAAAAVVLPSLASTPLDRPPRQDEQTFLLLHLDEPDEGIAVADKVLVDPVYVRMEARHQQGRFGGALKFVGRPGLRQCLLVSLPQPQYLTRHTRKRPPIRFADVEVPVVLMDNQRGYTIEFWMLPQARQAQVMLAGVNSATWVPTSSWKVEITGQGRLRFASGAGLHRFYMESEKPVAIGRWTHVAVVCDRGNVGIYLNGRRSGPFRRMELAERQGVGEPGSDGSILCVGGPGPDAQTGFFDGLIDEVRLSTAPRRFEPDPAILIGNGKELFLDDFLLARMEGIERVVNQPERYPGNPLLTAKGDWEAGSMQQFGTLYDPRLQLFRTWYRANNSEDNQMSMCYAVSRDGLRWEQPVLGLAEYRGSTRNNIVTPKRSFFVFLDPLARPGEGNICASAKMLYGSDRGTFKQILLRSPDGLHWPWGPVRNMSGYQGWPYSRIRRQEAVMATDRPLMQNPVYFARLDKMTVIANEGEGLKDRVYARIGWDLTHWQDPVLTDLKRSEKNNLGWYGIRTKDESSVLVGFTDAYHNEQNPDPRWRSLGPEAYHDKPSAWLDIQLISSRDGYRWQHVADQDVFLPVGPEGAWDEGMVLYAQAVEPPGSDRIYLYYQGSPVRHDMTDAGWLQWHARSQRPSNNMGVAFLRKEGYVSLEVKPDAAEGVVETRPLRYRGRHLFVNADASKGAVQVELCDETGNPLSGFGRKRALPLTTDLTNHLIRWGQESDVSRFAGQAVVLRFHLTPGAKLYAYRFGGPDPHLDLERREP